LLQVNVDENFVKHLTLIKNHYSLLLWAILET
jgi:hypothetical protein